MFRVENGPADTTDVLVLYHRSDIAAIVIRANAMTISRSCDASAAGVVFPVTTGSIDDLPKTLFAENCAVIQPGATSKLYVLGTNPWDPAVHWNLGTA